MTIRIIHILLFFLALNFTQPVGAQETLTPNWDAGKIKGFRFLPYAPYQGFPFLNVTWATGKIEFSDGEIADSLYLRYSSFKDELVYFNKTIGIQIVIDKASLNGFSFAENDGRIRVFRKQFYDGFFKSDRYFEVLSEGEYDLLAFRKVNLTETSPYKDESGILKNQIYSNEYQFYFYSPELGYTSVRISRGGFLAKFDKASQKQIKRLLRRNKIIIDGEESFIQASKMAAKEGFKIVY